MPDSRNTTKCLFEAMSFKMYTDLTMLLAQFFKHACSKQRIMVMLSLWDKGDVFLPDPLYLQGVIRQAQATSLGAVG